MAPRNWLRACSPRSATRERDVEDGLRAVAAGVARGGGTGPEQRREHRPPARRIGGHAVHHRPRQEALRGRGHRPAGRRPRRPAGRPGCARRRRPARRAAASGEPHQAASPRAASATWGSVDSQSMARCGSSIRAASATSASIAASEPGGAGSSPAGARDGEQPGAPDGPEVGHVLDLVVDRLGGHGEGVEAGEGALDEVGDRGRHRRQRTTGSVWAARPPAVWACRWWRGRQAGSVPVERAADAAATRFEDSTWRASRFSFSSALRPCESQCVE